MTPKALLGSGAGAQEAARDARRFLTAHVRNDWNFPTIAQAEEQAAASDAQYTTTAAEDVNVSKAAKTTPWQNPSSQPLGFEPVAWKEREYSFSDVSETSDVDAMKVDTRPGASSSHAAVPQLQRENRKRKRAQVLEDEMAWNAGLAHFLAERDAWTCARVPPSPSAKQTGHEQSRTLYRTSDDSLNSAHTDHSMLSTPASSPPSGEELDPVSMRTRLPIPEPILKDNPVRAKVRPEAYNEIYSKIIMQCRTPTVPINLADVINSCVRGWIAEGNWPPKPGPADPLLGRAKRKTGERHPHLRKGVDAVTRVFGLGSHEGKEKDKR